jgi:hypothetical protein
MAADVNTGMEKPEMKRLLAKSKSEPVNCAFGQGDDNSTALLMLDKVKGPKGVEKELSGKFPEAKNTRFGTALVDVEVDPKLVRFVINKPVSGIARKLVKTLKGTGYNKVIIGLEDGTTVDSHSEEEEGSETEGEEKSVAPPPPKLDPAMLTRLLGDLIKRIPAAVLAAPTLKDALGKLAAEATAHLKANQLTEAATQIAQLRKALDAVPASPAPPATPAAPARAEGAKVTYAKSRLAWLAARQKVESDMEKLRKEMIATFEDDEDSPELDKLYRARVAPVMAALDESLADKLDEAINAEDPGKRQMLIGEARQIIQRYTDYVDGESLIADLDDNPFVPVAIRATLTSTLSALSKTIV